MDQSHLVVVDALDGAGKTTVIRAMVQALVDQGLRVFDLPAYMKEHHDFPESNNADLIQADVLLSAEPTYSWVGAAIRQDLIKKHADRTYNGKVVATAFALDRQILFSRVILPFLQAKPDRWVIQDRGVITSLVYQPLQDDDVTLEWIAQLEGNQLELSRPPNLLLILDITATQAEARLSKREDKQDHAVFEKKEFQQRLEVRYHDPLVLAPYHNGVTKIVYIDATRSQEQVAQDACRELSGIAS